MVQLILRVYNAVWQLFLPFLQWSQRLKDGYEQRIFREKPGNKADIWIQAASAGEAYLALSLLQALPADKRLRVLISTNTRQGMEVLEAGWREMAGRTACLAVELIFFPFDKPSIMEAAVRHIDPGVMVLLESELWPGLLAALHAHNHFVLVINGRMTSKSFRGYRLGKWFWRALAPHWILAISPADAERFARLFGRETVEVMPNIKFDRIRYNGADEESVRAIRQLLSPDSGLLIFGSVREEEEADLFKMIRRIRDRFPDLILAIFPRHMHRLPAWQAALGKRGGNWTCRSELTTAPVRPGTIILWDTFGELQAAYGSATAVFVGGSLAPLGGQNFLEPLLHGLVPVIGPFWDNFAWAGEELFSTGLVRKTENWQMATAELSKLLAEPPPRQQIRTEAADYMEQRQGGTRQACDRIMQYLPFSKEKLP